MDGRSFAPLLTDSPPQRWRTAFLEEGWFERAKGSDASAPTPTNKGVHTQDHMFVEYDTGEYELYDLDRDPHQLQSMTRSEDEALYSQLNARLEKLKDCAGKSCRDAEGP